MEVDSKANWTVKDCARELGVNVTYYRRNVLPLPNHPTPIDPSKKNLDFWAQEMREYLGDVNNLKRMA